MMKKEPSINKNPFPVTETHILTEAILEKNTSLIMFGEAQVFLERTLEKLAKELCSKLINYFEPKKVSSRII